MLTISDHVICYTHYYGEPVSWNVAFESILKSTPWQVGPISPRRGASSGCGWRGGIQVRRVAVNIFNKQSLTADKGLSWSLRVGRGAHKTSP